LRGDFIGGALFEEAAGANVDAFGVFAQNDQANVIAEAVFQRSETLVEELRRTGIDEEVEFEAQAEEDVGGVLIGGHARIAQRTEKDGVEFALEHFDRALGKRDFFAEVFIGGPVEFDEFDEAMVLCDGGFDGGDADGSDFLADTVAGDDGDAGVGTAGTERDGWHEGKVVEKGATVQEFSGKRE